MPRYFIIYKPYQVLSQFSQPSGSGATDRKKTLKDLFELPGDVYPVGRLDFDSEGLLILTNDASLNHRLLHPSFRHEREYRVQVDGRIDQPALTRLRTGVVITVDGKPFHTKPCSAGMLDDETGIAPRNPPVRFRKEIPTSWITITLVEGKNRQVRKMTAAAGFPTLRLIRVRIEQLLLDGLNPGDIKELPQEEIYAALRLPAAR